MSTYDTSILARQLEATYSIECRWCFVEDSVVSSSSLSAASHFVGEGWTLSFEKGKAQTMCADCSTQKAAGTLEYHLQQLAKEEEARIW